jgi:hypothetical protein
MSYQKIHNRPRRPRWRKPYCHVCHKRTTGATKCHTCAWRRRRTDAYFRRRDFWAGLYFAAFRLACSGPGDNYYPPERMTPLELGIYPDGWVRPGYRKQPLDPARKPLLDKVIKKLEAYLYLGDDVRWRRHVAAWPEPRPGRKLS